MPVWRVWIIAPVSAGVFFGAGSGQPALSRSSARLTSTSPMLAVTVMADP